MGHQKLSGEVEIDTQYKSINLKGTRPQNMPRYSKKRGKQAAYRGISHHKVAIVCATDENDHMMMQISGLGSESFDKYKANKDHFEDVKEFISDSKASIQQFANYLEAVNTDKTSPFYKEISTDDGNIRFCPRDDDRSELNDTDNKRLEPDIYKVGLDFYF